MYEIAIVTNIQISTYDIAVEMHEIDPCNVVRSFHADAASENHELLTTASQCFIDPVFLVISFKEQKDLRPYTLLEICYDL